MTEHNQATPPEDGRNEEQANPEQLRADIERTREDLGETIDALAARVDVKTRVKERARGGLRATREAGTRVEQRTRRFAADTLPPPRRAGAVAAGATGAGLVAVALVWLRRRSARRRTPWQRAMSNVQRTGADVRDRLGDQANEVVSAIGARARDSELATKAVSRSKDAAAKTASRAREATVSPAGAPLGRCAGVAILTLLLLDRSRRRAAARRVHRAAGESVSVRDGVD